MAKNPDPNLKLTSTKGTTRTLDDWSTMFHLCLVILPPRPEASVFIPIAERVFKVLGDADCRTAFCVVGNEFIARGVLGEIRSRCRLVFEKTRTCEDSGMSSSRRRGRR